ncbi:MAG: hypothetical protein Q9159_005150 [Coniocarpon cinnabarinum]
MTSDRSAPTSDESQENDAFDLQPLSQEALLQIASHGSIHEAASQGSLKDLISTDKDLASAAGVDPATLDKVDHDTLKYHLLGPSLTKAGQDNVDQQRVSEIIYEASKGSKYFNREESKDATLTKKINVILARKRQLDKLDLTSDRRRAEDYIQSLELSRDLSQTIVHIDCDAFYAAVEELDRPDLKDVPFAVGKGVLTTCNYHARKFGCRSGMAGFVAMKLCPDLVCLPLNFQKYTAKAQEVRAILADYDPRFSSASVDEAYLNITEYCERNHITPWDAVAQLREEVKNKCKITISAGIAANAMLAKIGSNRDKPNGQFELPPERAEILRFMSNLLTRKVNGIGRVFERELDALGIKNCGDIYEKRAYLSKLFGDKAFRFLMSVYLGLGRTSIAPAEESERKSVGTESTFRDMSDPKQLREKLSWIAEELQGDMERTGFKGRTLVLKAKLHTYEVITRQVVCPYAIWKKEDLFKFGWPILERVMKDHTNEHKGPLCLRLMGLRCTHLVSTKKTDINEFFGIKMPDSAEGKENAPHPRTTSEDSDQGSEWETWPGLEFEESARLERQAELEEVEALSQEHERQRHEHHENNSVRRHGREILPNPAPASQHEAQSHTEDKQADTDRWRCPICQRPQIADDRAFNEHIDLCLSRGTIQDIVKQTSDPVGPRQNEPVATSSTAFHSRKRGRPPRSQPMRENKKLFFST